MPRRRGPIVYSCSGCSSAAQLANRVAVELDRSGAAEMSCIAGVGGDVPRLLSVARSGRPILALDGCALSCVKSTLARHGITPDAHVLLNELGVKKRYHADFQEADLDAVYAVALAHARDLDPEPGETR